MSYIPFNQIVDALEELDETQKQLLIQILQESSTTKLQNVSGKLTSLEDIREARFQEGLCCAYCDARDSFKKNGTYKGRQRYLCHTCKRTFNDLTNTPIHRTHFPDKWVTYLAAMEQGLSIRKCAKRVGISIPTAFTWRHKILHALFQVKDQSLEGVVEADETYIRHSEKGNRYLKRKPRKRGGQYCKRGIAAEQVCILVVRDRSKETISEVVKFGRMDAIILDRTLSPRLQSEVIFCSDEEPTFKKYCKDKKMKHERVCPTKKRYVTKEIYHIQNVNAYHQRIKSFLSPFRGIATKYANHYLAWHRFLDEKSELPAINKIKDMFLTTLKCPSMVNGTSLSAYCETSMRKMPI